MTTTFNPLTGGSSEDSWRASKQLSGVVAADVPPTYTRVVVVAAHPDDETLGAGGLLASCAARGMSAHVIIASDGEASHPASTTCAPTQLASIRRGEARAAVTRLAPTAGVSFLGLPDGSLMAHPAELADAISSAVVGPCLVVSPWAGDRHPDHQACAEAASAALTEHSDCSHWQYPIWAWHWGEPDGSEIPWHDALRVDLDEAASSAKRDALAVYQSQQAPLSAFPGDEPILPAQVLAHFQRPFEVFIRDAMPPASKRAYFDQLWSHTDDPWGLGTRFYEIRKREIVLACLPRPRFRSAFEPGCAAGQLTERLAARCEQILAWEQSARAVELATRRLAGSPNAVVAQGRIPDAWPGGQFDLIVLSEIGYYCTDLPALTNRVLATLAPDGVVLACHWRRAAPDHPQTAEQVHAALGRDLAHVAGHIEDDFMLDIWSRGGRSVAQADGIIS